jgi:hypothetical protein
MNSVTTLILKLFGTLILWIVYIGLVSEYIISREMNIIVQIISIMGGLLLTIWALNYMVKIIIKFINK